MGRLDDPQTEGRLLLGLADYLTVLLLTAGSALAFLSGYSVETDLGAVLFFCAFASAVSTVLHSLTKPWWSIAAACVIALIFWPAWETVSPVLQWLGRKLGLGSILTGLTLPASAPKEELLPVLLLLCAALIWIMGWMAVRVRRWYLAALLSFTLVLPAIQMGVLPMWGAMLAAFAGWGAMLLTALYGRRDPGGLGRAQLLSLGGMCALVMGLVMTLPMEGYQRPQWATDARTSLILGVRHQMERYFDMEALDNGILADLGLDLSVPTASGTLGSAAGPVISEAPGGGSGRRENLLAAGPRRYIGRRVLSVTTDQTDGGRIYLRGGSLGTYTGDSWEMVQSGGQPFFSDETGEAEAQPSLYPARTAADVTEYTMSIRDIYGEGVRFYPYRPTETGGWTDESGMLTLPNDDNWMNGILPDSSELYRVDYVPGGPEDGFTPLTGALAAEEELYRTEIAYSYRYLDVPDEAREWLSALMNRDTLEQNLAYWQMAADAAEGDDRQQAEETVQAYREFMDEVLTIEDLGGVVELTDGMGPVERFQAVITAASRTAEVLSTWAVYDPQAPAMEEGQDFVAHFLYEERGYCIHFATAGTLLLRMQGIPARYVTGYVVQLDSRGRGQALDSDAHAWVEIYLDGYGWYPVEMTPGYGGGDSGVELAGDQETEEIDEPDEPENDEVPEDEDPTPDEPEDDTEEVLPDGETEEAAAAIQIPWRTIGKTVLVLAALGGVYALALLIRRQARANPDANRSVISAYRRYRRVLRLGGVEDEIIEELARKAKFSQHTLTEEERAAVWQCLEQAVETAKKRQKKGMRVLLELLRPLL